MKRNLWKDKARARVPETHSREKYAVNQEIEHLSLQILDLSSHDLDNHPRNRVSFKRDDKNRTFSFFFISNGSSISRDAEVYRMSRQKRNAFLVKNFQFFTIFSRNENRCWRKKERKLTFVQFLLRSSQVTITCFHRLNQNFLLVPSLRKLVRSNADMKSTSCRGKKVGAGREIRFHFHFQ